MIFTQKLFDEGKSIRGGWSDRQLELIGVPKKKIKGWKWRIIGSEIPDSIVYEFLSLKDEHLKGRTERKREEGRHPDIFIPRKPFLPKFVFCKPDLPIKDQYLHPNWQKMRLFVLDRDKFTCKECCSRDQTLHVHHLKYLYGKFIWEVPHWYLVCLCDACHTEEHNRKYTSRLPR